MFVLVLHIYDNESFNRKLLNIVQGIKTGYILPLCKAKKKETAYNNKTFYQTVQFTYCG